MIPILWAPHSQSSFIAPKAAAIPYLAVDAGGV